MGSRLRNLVQKTIEEKKIKNRTIKKKIQSGKGKLTGKFIDKLTIYYGLAIRRNCNSVQAMKDAIWATYYHYSSTDKNPQHEKCPNGPESWCSWQRAFSADTLSTFKHDYDPLPDDVLKAIKPLYDELSNDILLERCLGGFTQNNNESLNQLIWKITPKILPAGSKVVDIAAWIAACIFNEGTKALLSFMSKMDIKLGPNCHMYAQIEDKNHIRLAEWKTKSTTKEERTRRRQERKDALDIATDAGPLLYGAGIDDSV
ncbi:LOC108005992 [Sergentomyia squamirostris]